MVYIVKLFSNHHYFFISTPVPDFNYYSIPKSDIET